MLLIADLVGPDNGFSKIDVRRASTHLLPRPQIRCLSLSPIWRHRAKTEGVGMFLITTSSGRVILPRFLRRRGQVGRDRMEWKQGCISQQGVHGSHIIAVWEGMAFYQREPSPSRASPAGD